MKRTRPRKTRQSKLYEAALAFFPRGSRERGLVALAIAEKIVSQPEPGQ